MVATGGSLFQPPQKWRGAREVLRQEIDHYKGGRGCTGSRKQASSHEHGYGKVPKEDVYLEVDVDMVVMKLTTRSAARPSP